jgi:hypothetical protein
VFAARTPRGAHQIPKEISAERFTSALRMRLMFVKEQGVDFSKLALSIREQKEIREVFF